MSRERSGGMHRGRGECTPERGVHSGRGEGGAQRKRGREKCISLKLKCNKGADSGDIRIGNIKYTKRKNGVNRRFFG